MPKFSMKSQIWKFELAKSEFHNKLSSGGREWEGGRHLVSMKSDLLICDHIPPPHPPLSQCLASHPLLRRLVTGNPVFAIVIVN